MKEKKPQCKASSYIPLSIGKKDESQIIWLEMDFLRMFLNQKNLPIPYRTHQTDWQNHHRIVNGSIGFRLFSLPWGPYTDPDAPGGLWLAGRQQKQQGRVPPSFGSGKKNAAPMTTGFAGDEVKASEQFEARGDQRGSPASQKPQIKTRGGGRG